MKPAPADPEFYRPVLEALWAAFEDRLVFASNWPPLEACLDYASMLGITGTFLADKPEGVRQSFYGGAALRAYGLEK